MTLGCVQAAFHGDTAALQEALDEATGDTAIADVVGLAAALAGKQAAGDYQPAGAYAAAAHDHDLRYFTQAQVTAAIAVAIAGLVNSAPGALDQLNELAAALGNDANFAATMTNALAGKQAADADLTAIAALATVAYGRALLTIPDQAALTALLAAATGALAGAMSAQDKTRLDAMATPYRTLLDSSGSHIAAKVAGTYGLGQGDPIAVSGTGTLYPLNIIYIDPADYPALGTLTAKLRLRCGLFCNDVAPTGNFTFGLHPITRPGTSGGAGLNIYTLGAAIGGSTIAVNTPAADSASNAIGADFAMPAAGFYVLGVVTTATIAVSAHVHLSAALQLHHS